MLSLSKRTKTSLCGNPARRSLYNFNVRSIAMKFVCSKTQLVTAVANVSRVIAAKSSIPSLEGVQLKAYGSTLSLTGYDMEAGITTEIEADVRQEGEIVLTARLFLDMIRKMTGDDITVSVGDKYLTEIVSGMTQFTILGTPSEEFPELPEIAQGTGVQIPQGALKSMIEQTLFAVAATDSKPIHTGSLFEVRGGLLTIVSVDGYRLALRREPVSSPEDMSFVVPGKALGEIAKLLDEESETDTGLMISKRHIIFNIGKYSVVSRLLEGEFLEYKNSIPDGCKSVATIPTRIFIDSVERVSLLISDRLRSPLRIGFTKESISLSCSTSLGKSYDEITCAFEGEGVEMGFNNKYLLDALKAAGSDEVRVEISGALSPIKVLPPQGDGFLFLVLPVRLKNEA